MQSINYKNISITPFRCFDLNRIMYHDLEICSLEENQEFKDELKDYLSKKGFTMIYLFNYDSFLVVPNHLLKKDNTIFVSVYYFEIGEFIGTGGQNIHRIKNELGVKNIIVKPHFGENKAYELKLTIDEESYYYLNGIIDLTNDYSSKRKVKSNKLELFYYFLDEDTAKSVKYEIEQKTKYNCKINTIL